MDGDHSAAQVQERAGGRRWWWLAGVVAALAAVGTACGGGSEVEPTPTVAVTGPVFGAFGDIDLETMAACMEAAGFDFDSEAGAAGVLLGQDADPAGAEALRACAAEQGVELPEGGPQGDFTPGGGAPLDVDIDALVACLSDAGIEIDAEAVGASLPAVLGALDRTSTQVQSALQLCRNPGGQ